MNNGLSFMGILQIVFIVLKLCKVIDWSWFLVLIPLWIELLIVLIVITYILILEKRHKQ